MSRGWRFIVAAAVAVVVGALLLKGFAQEGPLDPVARTANSHPRGLLALLRLLEAEDVPTVVRMRHDEEIEDGLLIVPPPEAARWTRDEVRALLPRIEAGALDVWVLCDDDAGRNRGVVAWTEAMGTRCDPEPRPGDAALMLGANGGLLIARSPGQLVPTADAAVAVVAETAFKQAVLALHLVGEGRVWSLGSASYVANDGLGHGANAALALAIAQAAREGAAEGADRRVVTIDEAHHRARRAEVLAEAFGRSGPQMGILALLLLVPLSLLGLAPRPGDPPRRGPRHPLPAAEGAARALAALYLRAGLVAREGHARADEAGEAGNVVPAGATRPGQDREQGREPGHEKSEEEV